MIDLNKIEKKFEEILQTENAETFKKWKLQQIKQLIYEFRESELEEWDMSFSADAEVWAGFVHFFNWLSNKD